MYIRSFTTGRAGYSSHGLVQSQKIESQVHEEDDVEETLAQGRGSDLPGQPRALQFVVAVVQLDELRAALASCRSLKGLCGISKIPTSKCKK